MIVRIKMFLVILSLFSTDFLFAQTISGRVIDKDLSEALPFANIVVLNASDSTYVMGTVTNEEGFFSLNISSVNHLVRVSFLGYETFTTKVTSTNMDTIYLSQKNTSLTQALVMGVTKTFRMENGGISADIQNSPLKNMGTLSEVLGQLPFVLKDQESYTVFGKGSPIFYINNRLVRDNFELQQISSKDIKKVTVITNPGAEYDASINAIIKIETIRLVGDGLSGNVYTYNRYNSSWYTQNRLSLNYRKSSLDIFGRIEFADMSFPKDRIVTNTIKTKDALTTIILDSEDRDKWKFWTPQIGFNYILNKDHSLGAMYEYFNSFDLSGKYNVDTEVLQDKLPEKSLHTDKKYNSDENNHYINAYYSGNLSKWLTMKLDLDYKTTKRKNNTFVINMQQDETQEIISTSGESTSNLYAGKFTLITPMWDGNLIYGTEASYTLNKQGFFVYEDAGDPGIVPSNNQVKQNLVAGFVSFDRSFGHFTSEIGIHYENVQSEYYQDELLIDKQSKRYQNLFPNVRLSYYNNSVKMELSLKNSIRRPSYIDLGSTIIYQAPYSYYSGNPLLQPVYQNSLTYMLMWKKITFMSVYSHLKDFIVYLPQLYMGNSIILKPINLDKSQQLNLTVNYTTTFGVWRPNWDLMMAKDFIEFGTPKMKYNKPVFSVNFRNAIQLNGWLIGLDFRARTAGNREAEYLEKFSWQTNVYLNKSFFNEKLLINISGNDIFDTIDDKVYYISNQVSNFYDNSMYRRNIIVSFIYRFNVIGGRYKGSQSSDELNRL